MIRLKLYNMGQVSYETIVPTLFPDATSQIWKVKEITKNYRNCTQAEIIWQWENESEYIHVAQLSDLLGAYTGIPQPFKILNIPFLPYGRQDKPITNNTTFAQRTFTKLIDTLEFDSVISFDVHGICSIKNLHKLSADPIIEKIIEDEKYEIACFPDGGACERYYLNDFPSVNGIKQRNQKTGEIEDYYLQSEYKNKHGVFVDVELKDKRVLICDDLVDGGATFIELMKLLKEKQVGEVGLYTSHGIFSKGKDHLIEAGISKFYYTNSLPKNEEDGIKVV